MVEAVVELVQHPGRARSRYERERPRNLVGEVEFAALGLQAGEGGKDRLCDDEERFGPLNDKRRAAPVAQSDQSILFAFEISFKTRKALPESLRRQMTSFPAARRAYACLAAILEEERVEKPLQSRLARALAVHCPQFRGQLPISVLACVE